MRHVTFLICYHVRETKEFSDIMKVYEARIGCIENAEPGQYETK
jgi:hypothetical protein